MPISKSYNSLVIGSASTGESDLLVTLLCKGKGKIRCIAKGAKKSAKRFMNALEPFTHIDAVIRISSRSGLGLLENAEIKEGYEAIRSDYRKFVLANLCIELVDLWCREGQEEDRIYILLLWYLSSLCKGKDSLTSTLVFKTRLLDACGYLSCLTKCSNCNRPVNGRRIFYNPTNGQTFCQECQAIQGSCKISVATVMSMCFWQRQPLERIFRLKVNTLVMEEAWTYLKTIHSNILERQPQTYRLTKHLFGHAG